MWLLPPLSLVSNAAARIYYRLSLAGERVPSTGPMLLVANHPNSLLDPMLVAAAAHRPVRFLAKAPLFTDIKVGWLVRASGAIPVYRRVDNPETMSGNVDMFRAVHRVLAGGAAIGIFPEGVSHSEPGLATLKTGAARIALGTVVQRHETFPIVPVGLVFRQKDVFRSEALAVVGKPIRWDDMAGRSPDDRDAVRELTDRIEAGMRQVTINLERWEDQPLVDGAEAIWQAERDDNADPARQVSRLETVTSLLAKFRKHPDARSTQLIEDVTTHCRGLGRLGITPGELKADVRLRASVKWGLRRFYLLGAPALLIAMAGLVLFWLPNWLTGRIAAAMRPKADQTSTYRLLVGIALYVLWIGSLATAAWWFGGITTGVAALGLVPVVGLVGRRTREKWRGAWKDAKRFFMLRSRPEQIASLQRRQREIAERLAALYETVRSER